MNSLDLGHHFRALLRATMREAAQAYLDATKSTDLQRMAKREAAAARDHDDELRAAWWDGQAAYWSLVRAADVTRAARAESAARELQRQIEERLPAPAALPTVTTLEEMGIASVGTEPSRDGTARPRRRAA